VDLLLEILAEFLSGGGEPPTNRALLLIVTVGGLALATASSWLVTGGVDVVHAPGWKVIVLLASLFVGTAGLLVAFFHLCREPAERGLAGVCLAINLAAVSAPVIALTH
jgi:hypothetical protein